MPGMKWIEPTVFLKHYLQTDGQTDGQAYGWIQYTPIPPRWVERGYKKRQISGFQLLYKSHCLCGLSFWLYWYQQKMLHSPNSSRTFPTQVIHQHPPNQNWLKCPRSEYIRTQVFTDIRWGLVWCKYNYSISHILIYPIYLDSWSTM